MNLDALRELDPSLVVFDAPLGPRTTYRVGGAVRALVTIASRGDVENVGRALVASAAPIVAVGNGSNLLVNEGVHDVVAVVLEGEFATIDWRDHADQVVVTLGAGVSLPVAARRLSSAGIVGFEWAVGVPGSFGGAVAMNAGGHGSDIAHSLVSARVWRAGEITTLDAGQLALGYRDSALRDGDLVLDGEVRLERGDAVAANERVREIVRWRREHQPGGANAGSVFRNPPGDYAARLIEAAGAKGLRHASASVSEKHANFIQADAGGRAGDVFALINIVASMVLENTGVALRRENRLLGFGEAT
ncbi:MAG TPA: UDP-N-acetylmuramate dehydrogenase [Acidimicrobiales bacterium]|nr:UDP-N-acetylmuramate dehydrogenase [Acidimicrobiales bacterium]